MESIAICSIVYKSDLNIDACFVHITTMFINCSQTLSMELPLKVIRYSQIWCKNQLFVAVVYPEPAEKGQNSFVVDIY